MEIMTQLAALLAQKGETVPEWLAERAREKPPFIYGSVDLRHSGTKLVPVDTNLFPGGFNNLSKPAMQRAAKASGGYLAHHFPDARQLLILPENHTRNLPYLENLACLRDILEMAGYEVRIGTLREEVSAPQELETSAGRTIIQEPVRCENGILQLADGYAADVVVANNDFTTGAPDMLKNCRIPVIPPVGMGWYRRRKREHFFAYDALARDFGEAFGLDHWLISAYFRFCGMVDFRKREGFECVATNAEMVLDILRVKYNEYGIDEDPYVYVKADTGTYGMGVMTVRSGEEVLAMNKKYRQKMDVVKEGHHNTEVVIQEGVPTIDKIDGRVAEPMIYVVDQSAVGGAFRTHDTRDRFGNLNAPGMQFYGMCDSEATHTGGMPRHAVESCDFRVYELIARLATLAAARETY